MSETKTMFDDGWIALEFDEELYPLDAIHGAAYVFLDRCHLHLDRAADKRVRVMLRGKAGKPAESQALAGDFENELLGQAWRRRIAADNQELIEAYTTRALAGAAGPPGLDDLLAMDIGEATAFEDPLGIAMSWEEKYTKKKADKAAAADPAAAAGSDAAAAAGSDPAAGPDPAGASEKKET
jgi:His-Xaa-Ser system protein HxsD